VSAKVRIFEPPSKSILGGAINKPVDKFKILNEMGCKAPHDQTLNFRNERSCRKQNKNGQE
jgi:hypothetical protein